MQSSHFWMTWFTSKNTAPKGQAAAHFPQPMQGALSWMTMPVSVSRRMLPVGQTVAQRVVTQWKQLWELKSSCSSPPSMRSLRTILRSRGGWMSFSSMQATAQAPQPVHLRTSQ